MDICVADAERGRGIVEACGAKDYQFADRGEDLDSLWEARRGCYMAAMTYREVKGDRVYVLDPSYYTLYTPFIHPLYTLYTPVKGDRVYVELRCVTTQHHII